MQDSSLAKSSGVLFMEVKRWIIEGNRNFLFPSIPLIYRALYCSDIVWSSLEVDFSVHPSRIHLSFNKAKFHKFCNVVDRFSIHLKIARFHIYPRAISHLRTTLPVHSPFDLNVYRHSVIPLISRHPFSSFYRNYLNTMLINNASKISSGFDLDLALDLDQAQQKHRRPPSGRRPRSAPQSILNKKKQQSCKGNTARSIHVKSKAANDNSVHSKNEYLER